MIGFALTGSFCTFGKAIRVLEEISRSEEILPIMSYNAYSLDTKFGNAADHNEKIRKITGKDIIRTIPEAEPIGPKIKLDCLVICPCTGNTMSKMANGICDTPVTMAAKAQLRNERPVVIALATNDALSGNSVSISKLMQRKNIYFVPFGQDNASGKPNSLVCNFEKVYESIKCAVQGKQIQPIFSEEKVSL